MALPEEALRPLHPAKLALHRAFRADLNERSFYLGRAELERVYGRRALRQALAQARSWRRLEPSVREQRTCARERMIAESRRSAVAQRLRALEIKCEQLGEPAAFAEPRAQLAAEREAATRRIAELDTRLLELSSLVQQRRRALRDRGVELSDEEVDFAHHQITLTDMLRRRWLRREESFERALINESLDALVAATRPKGPHVQTLREALQLVLREAIDPLLLACPAEEDGPEFCRRTVRKAIALLGKIASNPLVKQLQPRSLVQLLEELIKASCYPGYEGELVIAYGGSEDPPTVRIPPYILPGLTLLRQFREAGLPMPRLRILSAWSMAVAYNGIQGEVVERNAQRAFRLLDRFIREFFPDVAHRVELTLPSFEDFTQSPAFIAGVQHLEEFARLHPDNKQLKSLLKKAQKHGKDVTVAPLESLSDDERSALVRSAARYIASHIVECSFGDVRQHRPGRWEPEYVVKIGGNGERDFNFFQDVLCNLPLFAPDDATGFFRPNSSGLEKYGFQVTPIQIDAVTGSTAPYYMVSREEVLVDRLNDFTFAEVLHYYRSDSRLRTVAADLEALPAASVDGDRYIALLKAFAADDPA